MYNTNADGFAIGGRARKFQAAQDTAGSLADSRAILKTENMEIRGQANFFTNVTAKALLAEIHEEEKDAISAIYADGDDNRFEETNIVAAGDFVDERLDFGADIDTATETIIAKRRELGFVTN